MTVALRRNPYLEGNFAPIRQEDDFADLPVTGSMPHAIAGTLYRNGPNPQFDPRDENYHWFLGDGMVHAFRIAEGRVSYRNRYVRTPKWQAEHAAGKALFGSWGNPMTTDASVAATDSGVANTNIVWHAGRLLALEEGHEPFALDPVSLAPHGYVAYAGEAKRFTAHPKLDPLTGEMVFFAYSTGAMPLSAEMAYGVVDAEGRVGKVERFTAPFASMVHDFMVTERHALFPILPLTLSLERAMGGLPPVAWEPGKGARVGLISRAGGLASLRWFETEACYVFHVMNAWDDGDQVLADVMEYPVAPLFPNADGSPGAPAAAVLRRWTFDLSGRSSTIRRETLDEAQGEFPRIDDRRAGLPYRHGWFAAHSNPSGDVRFDAIAHVDHAGGRRTLHVLAKGDATSEPVFVPRSEQEGDGWLLAVVYRSGEARSDLVVLDALDLEAGPVAIAALPRRVPFGFHGNWVGRR